ncbi:MAG: short-chain dehydrogenase [Methylobacter sp.]|nr:MAG: short-chain dehydrogenase [Methylobacter sp.]
MKTRTVFDYPVFALGFRPFFALAGLSALILMVLWNAMFKDGYRMESYFSGNLWHAHEMLLGYTVAVLAGFLLTAVKNWTGRSTLTGDSLAGLCLLWLYARILPFYAGMLPDALIAAVDFAFLPVLAYWVSKPILQTRSYENLVFTGLLLSLTLGNGLIHAQILGLIVNTAWFGMHWVIATLVVTILVVAGRVFPFFTERGLPGTLALRNPLLDALAISTAALTFILQMMSVSGFWLALAAACAVAANAMRVAGWYVRRVWYVPLLWVLYAGYGWIILGFALMGLNAVNWVGPSLALHAFTVGGIGVLTLGMMARVALGHTGRALKASNVMALAFILINVAVMLRVLLPVMLPAWYGTLIYSATLSWLAAFSLFVFYYLPILTSARIDGQAG